MARGFWKLLFRPSPVSGVKLDHSRAWTVPAPPRPIRLAAGLRILLSENGTVALEGLSIHPEVERLLHPHIVTPTLEIRPGTLHPTSKWVHVRATTDALKTLNDLVNSFADPEVCDHMYGYENATLLMEWHDAFSDPIQIADVVSTVVIEAFCSELGVGPAKRPTSA
jgi:hypothetical protein